MRATPRHEFTPRGSDDWQSSWNVKTEQMFPAGTKLRSIWAVRARISIPQMGQESNFIVIYPIVRYLHTTYMYTSARHSRNPPYPSRILANKVPNGHAFHKICQIKIAQQGYIRPATGIINRIAGRAAGLVFCPPAEHREPMSGLAIPFSMWQCAGHGDAAGPGFVR